ncbi:hypothetical protein ColTof4_14377 [Colletotrichum tofieldiae]|nr:hypothetical protein ColTof3_14789 [Colletotrichum tofieldiae]GKT81954.1 hypothetical protein ColTof4_14377 [Colletotrichum tofieldiae]
MTGEDEVQQCRRRLEGRIEVEAKDLESTVAGVRSSSSISGGRWLAAKCVGGGVEWDGKGEKVV